MTANMPLRYEAMVKSYLGFLEGTQKSSATVSSYRGDLQVFGQFLRDKALAFEKLNAKDLATYAHYLSRRGLKTNTRRRKLLTAKSFYSYAWRRKKILQSPAQFLKMPARNETLPWIPTRQELAKAIAICDPRSQLGLRNRLLLELLAETGISISELCGLAWTNWQGRQLKVIGKRSRELRISATLDKDLQRWRKESPGQFLFPGFNRHGIFTKQMTARGVELIVCHLAKQSGIPKLKPKSLRHFAILHWLHQKVAEVEIIRRLGVREQYPLAPYRAYLENINRKAHA